MGALTATPARGKEIFAFEYNSVWLKSGHAQVLDPDANDGKGGSIYQWEYFLDNLPNCSAASRSLFTKWIAGNPKTVLCDAIRNSRMPGQVFKLDGQGCPVRIAAG